MSKLANGLQVVGLAAITYGVFQVSAAAGFIVGGLMLALEAEVVNRVRS